MIQHPYNAGIIISHHKVSCQVLEAPELDFSEDFHIPHATRESTYPIPFGAFSALNALNLGQLSAFEYSLYSAMNYRSNHRSGKTHYLSYRKLAGILHTSVRYIRTAIRSLIEKGFVKTISIGVTGTRYQLVHHKCSGDEVPTDKNGYPCKFSVARGLGSPDTRMVSGDISHKSKTVWEYLSYRSDWKTGITDAVSIQFLAKLLKMGKDTITACLKELTHAGLLKRLSKKHVAGVYQLYPKSKCKPKPRYRPKQDTESSGDRAMRCDGDWRLSYNQLWRVNVETCDIQTRKSRLFGKWRDMTLGDSVPKAIQRDFDLAIAVHQQLHDNLQNESVLDSAHRVPDSAQGVPDSAQGGFPTPPEPAYSKG